MTVPQRPGTSLEGTRAEGTYGRQLDKYIQTLAKM
jgi:hypothetical protein